MARPFSMVQSVALKHAKFSIKPLIRREGNNNGLSEYGMVMHDNVHHTDLVACKADGRTKVYITGLNEDAPEVQSLPDEEKEAKIKEIRKLVSRAEREIVGNYKVPAPDTKEIEKVANFWENVREFRSVVADVFDNKGFRQKTYWDELTITLDNKGIILDENNVKDLVIISIIEAGGFNMIARSYEEALSNKEYKFYYDKRSDTSKVVITDKVTRDKAGAKLVALSEGDANKLFYIAKLVSSDSLFFKTGKNATPNAVFYDECSNYIEGLTPLEPVKTAACEKFLKLASLDVNTLKAKTMIHDGKILRFIAYRENDLYHLASGTILGKNEEEAMAFLMNPANSKVFDHLLGQVQKEWTK